MAAGLTLRDAAKVLGLSLIQISELERGQGCAFASLGDEQAALAFLQVASKAPL